WTEGTEIVNTTLNQRWTQQYKPITDIRDNTYNSLIATIYEDEVVKIIKLMSNNKAPGPSLISYEVFKHLEENGIKLLCLLYNKIIEVGAVPKDWINSN
ncbi:10132_t:CDS:1, partial [Dentiscutata erythropus]